MLTVSVHGIRLHAKVGLYPEEKITGNDFEIDVDVEVANADINTLPFIDYAVINDLVNEAFALQGELLEAFVKAIYGQIKNMFQEATRVKVVIRKLHPPMKGSVQYSQVSFEG